MTDLPRFRPVRWLPGRDLQTIVPSFGPAARPAAEADVAVVPVAPGTAVRLVINRPRGTPRGTVLLIHGLGGSAESPYMRRSARAALERGWIAVRMNLRNCGGTEALSATLYNAGQSDDAGHVLAALDAASFPRPFAAAGFSLGGNLVLRYAGMAGNECRADIVAGVNPPVDLEACLRALERPRNAAYLLFFTILLCAQIRAVRRVRRQPGPTANPLAIRTVRRFDEAFTAPDAGYDTAEAYYAGASAGPHVSGIRVPALILSAENDPFVPVAMFDRHRTRDRNSVRIEIASAGGHCGFWASGAARFWAGEALMTYFDGHRELS